MTTYAMPEHPKGPVWDKNGDKWGLDEDTHGLFQKVTGEHTGLAKLWEELLSELGPVTDKPPVKVGDMINEEDLYALPPGSVVAEPGDIPFYKSFSGGWLNCYGVSEKAMTSIKPVVLRIGNGEG